MRDITNMNQEDAKKTGWTVLKDLESEVVGKAVFSDPHTEIMKSTKRFRVPGGWMYNTSTELKETAGTGTRVSVAEALAFVPDINMGDIA